MKRIDIEECDFDDDAVLHEGQLFTGILFSLHDNGLLEDEQEYLNGLPHGVSKRWYLSGSIRSDWHCVNGRAEGLLTEYFDGGPKELEEWREFGVVVARKQWSPDGQIIEDWKLDPSSSMGKYVERQRAKDGKPSQ